MQDINQHMDDLFRRAADDYPLRVNGANWQDIEVALGKPATPSSSSKKADIKKNIGLLLLLLFISLLLADGIVYNNLQGKKIPPQSIFGTKRQIDPAIIKSPNDPSVTDKEKYRKVATKYPNHTHPLMAPGIANNKRLHKSGTYFHLEEKIVNTGKDSLRFYTYAAGSVHHRLRSAHAMQHERLMQEFLLSPPDKRLPLSDPPSIAADSKKNLWRQKAIYLGVAAGPLLNEVKDQGLKKTGFSAGVIAGYRLGNSFSLETGLLLAQKPYFSTGQYFSMDKVSSSMPPGMEILSIEGKNTILEIPVKIKYDFLHGSARHFFSTMGVSSYICTNEKNNYLTAMNGVQQTMVSSYKNRSRSLAATLDFSAGYEHKIGPSQTIRIEPYLQIPLQGMGVGSMPMKSTGVKIGITQFLN